MEKNLNLNKDNSIYKAVGISTLIGIAVFAVVLPIFAIIITALNLNVASSGPLSSICIGLSSAVSGYFAAKKINSKGLIIGALCGFIMFCLVKLIALILNPSSITLLTLIHLAIILISGSIGGVVGVNSADKRKII